MWTPGQVVDFSRSVGNEFAMRRRQPLVAIISVAALHESQRWAAVTLIGSVSLELIVFAALHQPSKTEHMQSVGSAVSLKLMLSCPDFQHPPFSGPLVWRSLKFFPDGQCCSWLARLRQFGTSASLRISMPGKPRPRNAFCTTQAPRIGWGTSTMGRRQQMLILRRLSGASRSILRR